MDVPNLVSISLVIMIFFWLKTNGKRRFLCRLSSLWPFAGNPRKKLILENYWKNWNFIYIFKHSSTKTKDYDHFIQEAKHYFCNLCTDSQLSIKTSRYFWENCHVSCTRDKRFPFLRAEIPIRVVISIVCLKSLFSIYLCLLWRNFRTTQ